MSLAFIMRRFHIRKIKKIKKGSYANKNYYGDQVHNQILHAKDPETIRRMYPGWEIVEELPEVGSNLRK